MTDAKKLGKQLKFEFRRRNYNQKNKEIRKYY